MKAQKELAVATAAANAATAHALETAAQVSAAHRTIGKLAVNAFIMGGSLTDIEPLLSANGPQDLVDQLTTLDSLGAQNTTALNRYKAAEVVAKAAKIQADNAKLVQQKATEKVAVFAWLSSSKASARCCSSVVRTFRALINSFIKSSWIFCNCYGFV